MPLTSTGTCLRGPWLYPTLQVNYVSLLVTWKGVCPFFTCTRRKKYGIEILNFYLRSFIARYISDPVKTCLSNWYIFYYATRKMKTSISPNKKKIAWISWKLFGHFHLRFWKPCTCTYVYILFRCSYFFITFLHNMNTVWSGFSKFALYKVKNIHTYNV